MAGERISTSQVMMLVALTRIVVNLVYFPAMANTDLKQDVWLAGGLTGALWGIPFAWVLNRLWQRFPHQTFVQVIEAVMGKALGKALTFVYLVFLLLALSMALRVTGEFFVYAFLPRTPIIVIIGVAAVLTAWSAKAGIEVIARAGQVVFPLLVGTIVVIFVLLLRDIEFRALAPVFIQTGPVAHLTEMTSVVARNIEFVWVGMLVPFVNERRGLFRAVALGLVWQGVLWVFTGIAVTGVLGPFQADLYFPFFTAARQVSIADFLERVDALILSVWLLGMFLRAGMMLWAASLGTAQWLGLKHYRPLVIPLASLAVSYAIVMAENFPEVKGYLKPEIFTPYMLTFIWIIPVLVLAVAALRGLGGPLRPATAARG